MQSEDSNSADIPYAKIRNLEDTIQLQEEVPALLHIRYSCICSIADTSQFHVRALDSAMNFRAGTASHHPNTQSSFPYKPFTNTFSLWLLVY